MGYQIQGYPHPLQTALMVECQTSTAFSQILAQVQLHNCDALLAPIFSDDAIKSGKPITLDDCFIQSDEHYKKHQLNLINPIINSCIWSLPHQERKHCLSLLIGYSGYLGLKNICIQFSYNLLKLTNKILNTLEQVEKELQKCSSNLILIVQASGKEGEENEAQNQSIWRDYIEFRSRLEQQNFPLAIHVGLELKANMPSKRIVNRWKSQIIQYVIISNSCYTSNAKGYRILPAKHERVALQLITLKGVFTLRVSEQECFQKKEKKEMEINIFEESMKYILYVYKKMCQNKLRGEKDAINLIDYLQNPLQPYADNLESITYQIFENDAPKYDLYQSAIQQALLKFPKNKKIVVYYIGAGRGGLLFNIFAASKKEKRNVFVYAIQKNIFPIQTIKKRAQQNGWGDFLKIVYSDIRDYEMPEKPDIFISELLGGFGDNQLSPECLFWAEKNIAKQTICIPMDYTSYIKPVSYQGVHRSIQMNNRHCYYTVNYGSFYTPFESQQVWKFCHPLKGQQEFNKYNENIFNCSSDLVVNGFAGYFTSSLDSVTDLSILPEKPTFGMYSWFPLFFPFETSVCLKKGESIKIQMWRKHRENKVWYQWRYRVGQNESIIHNLDGWKIVIEI